MYKNLILFEYQYAKLLESNIEMIVEDESCVIDKTNYGMKVYYVKVKEKDSELIDKIIDSIYIINDIIDD